eukprot:scaffold47001_cov42-Prasinocladus_malaysianus.AAC.1
MRQSASVRLASGAGSGLSGENPAENPGEIAALKSPVVRCLEAVEAFPECQATKAARLTSNKSG